MTDDETYDDPRVQDGHEFAGFDEFGNGYQRNTTTGKVTRIPKAVPLSPDASSYQMTPRALRLYMEKLTGRART